MRPEDTELAAGIDQTANPAPVLMDIRVDLINAPKDIKAIWAIEQVITNLDLTPQQAYAVLKFMAERAELPF
jgi:hypothetical protein